MDNKKRTVHLIFNLDKETDKEIFEYLNKPFTNKTATLKKATLAYMKNDPEYSNGNSNNEQTSTKSPGKLKNSSHETNSFKGFNGYSEDF